MFARQLTNVNSNYDEQMTNETIGDRIRARRKAKKLTQKEVADHLGVTPSAVTQWELGNTAPKKLADLSELLGVDYRWLETGKGTPEPQFKTQSVIEWDDDTPLDSDEIEIPHYSGVTVCAGSQEGSVMEQTDRKIRMAKSSARKAGATLSGCFSFNISGDSMAERIPDGSRCTADSTKTEIIDGKIYVFRHGASRRTKYLHLLPPDNKLLIRSHNKEYGDEVIEPEDMDQIEILGWVWEWSIMERW